MDLGTHATFIVVAYAAATGIVAALILWVLIDRRRLAQAMAELETQGVTRRAERENRP